MKTSRAKEVIEEMLALADVRTNGDRAWDILVDNPGLYDRILAGGSMALGESYMDGWWQCPALDQFFDKILSARLDKQGGKAWAAIWAAAKARLINAQSRSRAGVVGKRHYDTGNELFAKMLDKRMNYSCAFWDKAGSLDQAQENKLDLICRKIGLKPGMSVLDIGCGWGGYAGWAAEKYQARVLGITVSQQQVNYIREHCRDLEVAVELQDYRQLRGEFDRIVSIGMFEHVGARNYRTFMQVVRRCLKDDGLFLLHTIGGNTSTQSTDPWIGKYIFPNSMLPSTAQIASASEGLLVLEDWHSFGPYYDETLMAWHRNFSDNWDSLKAGYDDRFFRMWTYYLLSCAGSFRARRNQLWQIVFSKKGLKGGYHRPCTQGQSV